MAIELRDEAKDRATKQQGQRFLRVTSTYITGQPGVSRQFDPKQARMTFRIPFASLEWSIDERKYVKRLLESASIGTVCSHYFEYSVNDFPFREQNRQRGMSILRDLMNDVRAHAAEKFEGPSPKNIQRRPKPSLIFPMRWLKQSQIQDNRKMEMMMMMEKGEREIKATSLLDTSQI